VRQTNKPGGITAIGFLLRRWELRARLQGDLCREGTIAAVCGIGSGVQQHPVPTVLYLTQVGAYRCVGITVGGLCEGSAGEPVGDDQGNPVPQTGEAGLDARLERAGQVGVLSETLPTQGE